MSTVEQREEQLANAERRLAEWDERHSTPVESDHGFMNLSRRVRNGKRGIDSLARERGELAQRVEGAKHALSRARAVSAAPAERAVRAVEHENADLKARYGGCKEVFWTLADGWLEVVRWNRKTVTVRMGGETESIPHDQVGGAR